MQTGTGISNIMTGDGALQMSDAHVGEFPVTRMHDDVLELTSIGGMLHIMLTVFFRLSRHHLHHAPH